MLGRFSAFMNLLCCQFFVSSVLFSLFCSYFFAAFKTVLPFVLLVLRSLVKSRKATMRERQNVSHSKKEKNIFLFVFDVPRSFVQISFSRLCVDRCLKLICRSYKHFFTATHENLTITHKSMGNWFRWEKRLWNRFEVLNNVSAFFNNDLSTYDQKIVSHFLSLPSIFLRLTVI